MKPLSISPCNLCPRLCAAQRSVGERGVCGAGSDMLIGRAALHFWEEPPLSGERGSGAIFFADCPLQCVYCQNAELATGQAGLVVSVERLAEICLELQNCGALNLNFVTPTHYSLQIREALQLAREQGLQLPVMWNTSSYERVETIHALAGVVDIFLADYKYADSVLAAHYSKAPDYPKVALAALETMLEVAGEPRFDEVDGQSRMTSGVIVRQLLLPGALENSQHALERLWKRFGNAVLYSIMNQYTPVLSDDKRVKFPELAQAVPVAEYESLLDFADGLGIENYFWQEGPADDASFIPAWDGTGLNT